MKNFVGARTFPEDLTYHRPSSVEEALELLGSDPSARKAVAGGTDVVPMVRRGALTLPAGAGLVDVTGIAGFREIHLRDGWVYVGPAVTLAQLTGSAPVLEHGPILAQAAGKMASPQIRNTATIGGNLCTASPGADTAPPLLALDAEVILRNRSGERVVPLGDFFTGPGRTVMEPGELLAGVRFPAMPAGERTCFLKLGRRKAFTLSVISVAVRVALESGVVRDARVALGVAAPTPMRARETERALIGRPLQGDTREAAARQVREEIAPRSSARASAEYRRDLAGVLLKRALAACASGA